MAKVIAIGQPANESESDAIAYLNNDLQLLSESKEG